jgi:hypothetical protein
MQLKLGRILRKTLHINTHTHTHTHTHMHNSVLKKFLDKTQETFMQTGDWSLEEHATKMRTTLSWVKSVERWSFVNNDTDLGFHNSSVHLSS